MCGILGIVSAGGAALGISDAAVITMRDRMAHRGPDGAGLWRRPGVVLAHRRLAVIDPTPAGHQPMDSPGGRSAIVYNGELYNDRELRQELGDASDSRHRSTPPRGTGMLPVSTHPPTSSPLALSSSLPSPHTLGVAGFQPALSTSTSASLSSFSPPTPFISECDTETLLHTLDHWSWDALHHLRGMYAFGHVDLAAKSLTLARDPLGIKPLYYTILPASNAEPAQLVFASEIQAILAHPRISANPDLVTVSSYLTTIRTTLGPRTLFDGVSTLQPGEWLRVDFSGSEFRVHRRSWWDEPCARGRVGGPLAGASGSSGPFSPTDTEALIRDSVARHLRSDVPTCCLLSGGLDSTIIATLARDLRGSDELWTYCSGARDETPGTAADDFTFARGVSSVLGSRHIEAPVSRALFAERWPAMIEQLGLPLSTPNEVAIHEVARRLRDDGKVVTLSGEGADELFAGYEGPMTDAARHVASQAGCDTGAWASLGGEYQLAANAWVPLNAKPAIFRDPVWKRLEDDAALRAYYRDEFRRVAHEREDPDPLQAHLRFMRRINLAGLLARLDTSTMLASVEGRTPFADQAVTVFAESLPMQAKFDPGAERESPAWRTKIALRHAFENRVPESVLRRPKASFPLPFQAWAADTAPLLRESRFARELWTDAAIQTVSSQPDRLWQLAWPMINLAAWARRWWC